jgi:hypothetical protein
VKLGLSPSLTRERLPASAVSAISTESDGFAAIAEKHKWFIGMDFNGVDGFPLPDDQSFCSDCNDFSE